MNTAVLTETPHAGRTLREVIISHGLEALRGLPIDDGGRILYMSDTCLDGAIALWEDEPERAYLQKRFYGSEIRGDRRACVWVYSSQTIASAQRIAEVAAAREAPERERERG